MFANGIKPGLSKANVTTSGRVKTMHQKFNPGLSPFASLKVQFKGTRLVETKLYNHRAFTFGLLDGAVIKDIVLSLDGTGATIKGDDVIEFLRQK
jgi:hypothetical protein